MKAPESISEWLWRGNAWGPIPPRRPEFPATRALGTSLSVDSLILAPVSVLFWTLRPVTARSAIFAVRTARSWMSSLRIFCDAQAVAPPRARRTATVDITFA